VKVDLLQGRISGTISYFKIGRENATYFYGNAPAPRANFARAIDPVSNINNFDPSRARTYAVRTQYFPAGYVGTPATTAGYFAVNYDNLAASGPERTAIEAAFRDTLTTTPINYGDTATNNPSKGGSRGSDVSYEEDSSGIDAQLIFSPLPNWQIVTSYAYINKEVSDGFKLVDHQDLNDGRNYGTEYDAWLYELGRENFSDPKRSSTYSRQSLIGRSLDLGPKQTASLFSNYRITEGTLKDLSFRVGVIFTGARPTTVDFGGANANVNTLPTPDVDRRYEISTGLGYRHRIAGRSWRYNLAVNNLLDDRKNETFVSHALPNGTTTDRRQVTYFRPRSIRLSASVEF